MVINTVNMGRARFEQYFFAIFATMPNSKLDLCQTPHTSTNNNTQVILTKMEARDEFEVWSYLKMLNGIKERQRKAEKIGLEWKRTLEMKWGWTKSGEGVFKDALTKTHNFTDLPKATYVLPCITYVLGPQRMSPIPYVIWLKNLSSMFCFEKSKINVRNDNHNVRYGPQHTSHYA